MATENQYERIFRPLLKAVEQDRARLVGAGQTAEKYAAAIIAARGRINEAQTIMPRVVKSREGEVFYFKQIWPRLYGRLFYYQKVYCFLTDHAIRDDEGVAAIIRREEMEARHFFRTNREFWQYYVGGSMVIDSQFTRVYSRECIFDPLCLVIDQLGTTLASYKAAGGLAYEWYMEYLRRYGLVSRDKDDRQRFEWKESRSAAVEWIKAQAEAGSIFIDGIPATAAQLKADFEHRFGEDLKGFDRLLYARDARKKDPTPYLNKLRNALLGRRIRLRK